MGGEGDDKPHGSWYVLAFSADEVIGAWQDARLADDCARAWRAAGQPPHFAILQTAGEGDSFLFWYLDGGAAAVLDAGHVDWRRFVIGSRNAPPAAARPVMRKVS